MCSLNGGETRPGHSSHNKSAKLENFFQLNNFIIPLSKLGVEANNYEHSNKSQKKTFKC